MVFFNPLRFFLLVFTKKTQKEVKIALMTKNQQQLFTVFQVLFFIINTLTVITFQQSLVMI